MQVIIFAVPFKDLEAAVKGAGDLTGKIVVDATNPVVFANGKLSLTIGTTTSAGKRSRSDRERGKGEGRGR